MNQAEERLSKAMEDLAAQAPPSAPPGLGVNLRDAFRRHHLRRRRRRLMWAAALATVIIAAFLAREKLSIHPQQAPALTAQATPTPDLAPPRKATEDSFTQQPSPHAIAKAKGPRRKLTTTVVAHNFVPLPSYEPALSTDEFKIVRLGLTSDDLYQMGLPAQPSTRRVLTDVLIDRDGIPVAVRLASR